MQRHTKILPKPVLFTMNCNPLSETKADPTEQQGLSRSKFPVGARKSKSKKKTSVKMKCGCESHVRRANKIRVK